MNNGSQPPRSQSLEPVPGVRLAQWFDRLRQDIAYAARGLARNPGFAATALGTLALGVGASAAMFSVVNSVLLRPLPYAKPDRLVAISTISHKAGGRLAPSGFADIENWRQSSRTLQAIAIYDGTSVVIEDTDGTARRTSAVNVSANMFDVLGVTPALGRAFTAEEADRREALAVITQEFHQQQFGGSEAVLGSALTINGRPYRIIGVMPPKFRSPDPGADMLLPDTLVPGFENSRVRRGPDAWRVIARLAPGVGLDEARTELTGIASTLAQDFPATNADTSVVVMPLALQVTGSQLRLALFTLVGAVAAVLLIACSNVAGLLLARGAVRRREFAVRTALGASRTRIVGQLVIESLVLAGFAAAAGSALAAAALRGIRAFGPGNLPRLDEIALDGPALTFAVCLAFISAALSSLLPALRSTARDPMAMMRDARGQSEAPAARRLRSTLVAGVFALAVVLLTATALLGRSLARLTAVDTGFHAERVLVAGLTLPRNRPEELTIPFVNELLERARALPGVRSAATSEEVLLDNEYVMPLSAEASQSGSVEALQLPLRIDAISPDFFRTVGVPLRQGRFFDSGDQANSMPVVIINETLARKLWPEGEVLGRRLRPGGLDSNNPWETVVGVVADMRRQGPDRAAIAQAFRPYTQRSTNSMNLLIATDVPPESMAASIRALVHEVDRSVPVSVGGTLDRELDRRLDSRRFILGLIGAFAMIALALAGVGIFGLINYSVTRRTQEIGVRMALGAQPGSVLRMVLADGLKLAIAGIVCGIALSAMLLPALASMLFEVSLADPVSLILSISTLVGVALFACYLPARRAVAVNPVTALRAE